MAIKDQLLLKEVAQSYIESELSKINYLKSLYTPKFIKIICDDLITYLNVSNQILDKEDLLSLRTNLLTISEIINLLLKANPTNSSWWAKPLIQQCYKQCGIDYSERNILIIHSHDIGDFSVYPNIIDYLPYDLKEKEKYQPVDIFTIPSDARFDISSIALVGHEVGHIFWQLNSSIIEKIMLAHFDDASKYIDIDLFNFTEFSEKQQRIASHIEEYLCDKIGNSIFGPAFDFSLLKLFCSLPTNNRRGSSTHPPEISRILQSFDRLEQCKDTAASVEKNAIDYLWDSLEVFHTEYNDTVLEKEDEEYLKLTEMIYSEGEKGSFVDNWNLSEVWLKIKNELDCFRPPFETVKDNRPEIISPIEIVIGVSLYYHGNVFIKSNEYYLLKKGEPQEKKEKIRETLIKHMCYAISLYNFVNKSNQKFCDLDFDSAEIKSTLWRHRNRISGGKVNATIVTPTIDPKTQYGLNSVDLRLGTSFLVNRASRFTHISPKKISSNEEEANKYFNEFFEKIQIPIGKEFILHPHQFVLASTLEYICLPYDYYALVLGRSTWGRLGLNIATATTVQAGFRGCLTLELRNLGETPLPLTTGTRIAQLCLIPAPIESTKAGYFAGTSKYVGPVAAELPKIQNDQDWIVLANYFKGVSN